MRIYEEKSVQNVAYRFVNFSARFVTARLLEAGLFEAFSEFHNVTL